MVCAAQLLKQFGHPMMLAARYPARRHVMAPAIFPFYWFVLKMALLGMLVIHVIACAVLVATGTHASDLIASLVTLPGGARRDGVRVGHARLWRRRPPHHAPAIHHRLEPRSRFPPL